MSRFETQCELFVLLGNAVTVCLPYKMDKGEITCTGMHSIRLSTSFGINNNQIVLGYVMDGKAKDGDEDYICGFVDCFANQGRTPDAAELQKSCSCNVKQNPDGRIEYEVKHLNNQILTPAIALQLFIKYLVVHETTRSNVSFSRVTVAYPVYFTESTAQYLEYLLQSCLMIPLRCVSQLSCFVSGFGVSPTTPTAENRTLVLFADYSLFHVFACTHTSSRIVVRSHLETTRLSHSELVNITMSTILQSLDGVIGSNVVKESMDALFTACYQMLNKYTVQSVASLELSVKNTRYKRTFTDNAIFKVLSPLLSLLTTDISMLCSKLQWEPSSLSRIILTGEASSLFVFRRWLQQDFPSIDTCCCYDIFELLRSTPDVDKVLEWDGTSESLSAEHVVANATLPANLFDVLHHRRRKDAMRPSEEPLEVEETEVLTPLSFKVSLDAKDTEMIFSGDALKPKELTSEVTVEAAKAMSDVTLKQTAKSVRLTRGKEKQDEEEKQGEEEVVEVEEVEMEEEKEEKEIEKETEEEKGERKLRRRRGQSVNWDALTVISGPRKASVTALETMRKQLLPTRRRRGKKEMKEEREKEEKRKKEEEIEVKEKEERKVKEKTKEEKKKQKQKEKDEKEKKKKEKEKKSQEKKEKKGKKGKKESVSSSVSIPVPSFHIDSFRLLPTERLLQEWTLLPKQVITQPATLGTQQGLWDENLVSPLYTAAALQEDIPVSVDNGMHLHHYSNGATYSGGVEEHKRSGSGKLTYSDGSSYQGNFSSNARQGNGTMRKKNKCFFKGVFEADAPKKGLLTYSNGARYSGYFDAGLPHGEGIYYGNGQEALWDGEWSHGRMDGMGTYFFDNGNYYDGRMKEGQPDGEGAICDKEGNVLVKGKWKEGCREGEFLLFFPDGSYCSVNYEKDVKNGPCSFYDAQKTLVGSGKFEKDVFSGKGRFRFKDGSVYEGEVKEGEYDGEGVYTFPDSLVIKAVYTRNQKNGKVEITKGDSMHFEGTCKKNKVDGPGTERINGEVVYKGNYTSGIPHGKGIIYFDNRMYYQGTVKKGVVSGLGTIYDTDGKEVHRGSFLQNKFVGSK